MKFSYDTQARFYYLLKPTGNPKSTLYIPLDNESLRERMRDVFSKQEIDSLLCAVRNRETQWMENRSARSDYFHEILSGGIHENFLLMIRCIYLKKEELSAQGRKLPMDDENILQTAEKLVKEEFAYSLDMLPEHVGEYIQTSLGNHPGWDD